MRPVIHANGLNCIDLVVIILSILVTHLRIGNIELLESSGTAHSLLFGLQSTACMFIHSPLIVPSNAVLSREGYVV
jgi:hypothetical protein